LSNEIAGDQHSAARNGRVQLWVNDVVAKRDLEFLKSVTIWPLTAVLPPHIVCLSVVRP
jgi:hypothetical protein